MASIGEITATLGLNTRQFNANADQADDRLRRLTSTMRGGINTAGKYGVAMSAAAAVLGGAVVKQALESAREIKNLSAVAGESVEAFQNQAYAAKAAGIEQGKYADILKDAQDRVGDFLSTGGGPMADYFEQIAPKIGQTADEFRNLSGSQVLEKYVSGLEQANVSQDQMVFYLEAMASDSTQLLPLLRNNAEELNRMAGEADRLGLALSSAQLDQMEEANQAVDLLGATMSRVSTVAVAEMSPAIRAVAEVLLEDLQPNLASSKTDVVDWGDTLGRTLAFAADSTSGAIKTIGTLFASVGSTIGASVAQIAALMSGEWDRAMSVGGEWKRDQKQLWSDLLNNTDVTKYRDRYRELRQEMENGGATNLPPVSVTADAPSGTSYNPSAGKSKTQSQSTVQTVDTSALDEARLTLERLQGTDIDTSIEVDRDDLDAVQSAVDALAGTDVDLGRANIDTDELDRVRDTLRQVQSASIDTKRLDVSVGQVNAARDALESLSADTEIMARVGVDTTEITTARSLLDDLSEAQINGKRLDVDAKRVASAESALTRLADIDLSGYDVGIDIAAVSATRQALTMLQSQQITPKTMRVDRADLVSAQRVLQQINGQSIDARVSVGLDQAESALARINAYDLDDRTVDVEYEVDADALETADDLIEQLQASGVDLGSIGLNTDDIARARQTLRELSSQRIDDKEIRVDSDALQAARESLASLAGDDEITARVGIDTTDIEYAQGLLDRMAATEFDPKSMQISTTDAARARNVLRQLQGVRLDEYGIDVDTGQLDGAITLFNGLSDGKLPVKQAGVDTSQIQFAMTQVAALKQALATVPNPEELQPRTDMQRQREQEAERRREMLTQRVDQLRQTLATEAELENQRYEQRIALLQTAKEQELETESNANELIEKEKQRHEKAVRDIALDNAGYILNNQRQFLSSMESIQGRSWGAQVGIVTGALANMTAEGARQNRALFEINKAAGIANATISTYEAANKAMSSLPFPANLAAAAAVTAAGIARVSAISSTNFGSGGAGGGAAAPTSAAGAEAPPVDDVGNNNGEGSGRQSVFIDLRGRPDSERKAIRDLMQQIGDELENGTRMGPVTIR